MRLLRILPLTALFLVGACDEDGAVKSASLPPLAYIRYVNAVPDAGTLDFKFMDAVEFSPSYANSPFRTVGIYQGARAGTRIVRVFRNSTDITIAQQVILTDTLTLVANTYYTILHAGYTVGANGPAQSLILLDDTRPTQGAGLHVSTVNTQLGGTNPDVFICVPSALTLLGGGGQTGTTNTFLTDSVRFQVTDNCGNNVDAEPVVFTVATGGGLVTRGDSPVTTGPNATIITTAAGRSSVRWRMGATIGAQTLSVTSGLLGPVTVSANAPTLMAGLRAEDSPVTVSGNSSVIGGGSPTLITNVVGGVRNPYAAVPLGRFSLRTANTGTTAEITSTRHIAGVLGTNLVDPVGGYLIGGTQFTAFLFPASIVGSAAASFPTPGITIVPDRQPPRTVPD